MKRTILIIFAFALLSTGYSISAGAQNEKKLSKTEKRQQLAKEVKDSINNRHFTINVNMAYPMGHNAINLTSNYSLQLIGDSVVSYLPYYGRAFRVPYGGGKGLCFSSKIKNYKVAFTQKGMARISFDVTNEEDTYKYTLEIYDNANTTINVNSYQREFISFNGELDTKQ